MSVEEITTVEGKAALTIEKGSPYNGSYSGHPYLHHEFLNSLRV